MGLVWFVPGEFLGRQKMPGGGASRPWSSQRQHCCKRQLRALPEGQQQKSFTLEPQAGELLFNQRV